VAQKTSKARANLHRILRIVNISRGLSPSAVRQLYLACVISIADYGSIIWWKGQKSLIKPLQAIQNTACLRILGTFKTALILAREIEAALLPPYIHHITFSSQNFSKYSTFLLIHSIDNYPFPLQTTFGYRIEGGGDGKSIC
jgi:hypothetical protein